MIKCSEGCLWMQLRCPFLCGTVLQAEGAAWRFMPSVRQPRSRRRCSLERADHGASSARWVPVSDLPQELQAQMEFHPKAADTDAPEGPPWDMTQISALEITPASQNLQRTYFVVSSQATAGGPVACHHVPSDDTETDELEISVNRPFVESHILSNGDIIDCVRIEDQLTMQHPSMKNHVTREPSDKLKKMLKLNSKQETNKRRNIQHFQDEVGSCPDGTIPILRMHDPGSIARRNKELREVKAESSMWNFSNKSSDAQPKVEPSIVQRHHSTGTVEDTENYGA